MSYRKLHLKHRTSLNSRILVQRSLAIVSLSTTTLPSCDIVSTGNYLQNFAGSCKLHFSENWRSYNHI